MNTPDSNPLFVVLLFLLRCLVPLAVMLGVSYLLRKFGFIKVPTALPSDYEEEEENPEASNHDNGDYAHGKV
jgi:hypothetical protein